MGGCRNRSEPTPFVQPEVDIGTIILWGKPLIEIPAGWQLCDGTNGTPDLDGIFPQGAGAANPVGGAGGNRNHNHTFTGAGHTHVMTPSPPGAIMGGATFENVTSSVPATGTTDNSPNRPPFLTLAYIQKVA